MITCHLHYRIDPEKLAAFEEYARRWMELVPRFGGRHLGYFLPGEGANDVAMALFSFDSLAHYERYRARAARDADCIAAYRLARESGCILRYERSFYRPLTPPCAGG